MKVTTIQRRWVYVIGGAAVLAFSLAFVSNLHGAEERLDTKVRSDFFAGFAGDAEALKRAMAATEAVLKDNPKNAEALVWHGTGIFSQAGAAFRSGDQVQGQDLFAKSMQEMDEAVTLAPNSVGVRIPRGAVLLKASVYMPEEVAHPLIEKGISDYERVLEIQKARLNEIGQHPKGELLFGLGDAYARLGQPDKAQLFFERVTGEMAGSPYAKRAAKWLDTKTLTKAESGCIGCHVK
jgi:tetratricopeptide (TPR) repeat protein